MPISLHAAIIPSMLQILGATKGWIDKAEASPLSEDEVLEARLIEDMLPFAYQVKSVAVHTQGALEGVRRGIFSPDLAPPPASFAGLRERLDEAITYLDSLGEDEIEALRKRPMRFEFGERKVPFTVPDFLLSFSQPNFYFHASTAYGILRAKGIEVGKRDFLGALRVLA